MTPTDPETGKKLDNLLWAIRSSCGALDAHPSRAVIAAKAGARGADKPADDMENDGFGGAHCCKPSRCQHEIRKAGFHMLSAPVR